MLKQITQFIAITSMLCCAQAAVAVANPIADGTTNTPASFEKTDTPNEQPVSTEKPVMLTADNMEYLQAENKVIASGNVEVVQGDTLVICDKLSYDRTNNIVRASGNVSVMEAGGNVVFAEEIELKDDLVTGVINQFKARLSDDSLFAADRAVKVDENITELDNAVYSPCKIRCNDSGDPTGDPLWQLRADHVQIDEKEQTVTYKNAQMELYGVPFLYTPYLSHATPNANNKSGIIPPEFGRNKNLGSVYKTPFYYAIAPDKDVTITPIITSQEGIVLAENYRQKFDNGAMTVDGSVTHPRDRDALGNVTNGNQWRGHMFAKGDFDALSDNSYGFDVKRTTDDTYLRRYDFGSDTQLTSRAYSDNYHVLGSSDRNSLSVEALAFQGLTAQDDAARIPLILPMVEFDYESDPGAYNDRFFIDSNAMVLSRDIGSKTRRLSNKIGWKLPYISEGGQMIEFETSLRGDVYNVSDVLQTNGQNYDGTTGRLVPEVSALWHYPFIKTLENGSALLEPIMQVTASPNGGNPGEIPNEDSLVPEFTDTNLFDANRFAGYDRIETGTRASYGVRGLVNVDKAYLDGLFGQHYRLKEDPSFPFSNDPADRLSDYVGKLGIQYMPFYLAYRFRLDKQNLAPHRSEFDFSYSAKRYSLGATYLSIQKDPIFASREELSSYGSVNVTPNWTLKLSARNDLQIDQMTGMGSEIIYNNECLNISNVINREFTRDRDVKPSTSFLIRVSFKNLN